MSRNHFVISFDIDANGETGKELSMAICRKKRQ